MKKLLLTASTLFVLQFSLAQTVPNGGFEQYSTCPQQASEMDSVLNWFNPTVYPGPGGSPDYCNACSSSPWVGVPYNWNGAGYQHANNGDAYAGLYLYYQSIQNYREYIEVQLDEEMVQGTCYHFSMFVNLSNNSEFTTDAIGAYFSDTLVDGVTHDNNLPFTPQITNTAGDFDTLNWTLVEGEFVADGGERYLIIGNFSNDGNTNLNTGNSSGNIPGAYCYVDDVHLAICVGTEEHGLNLAPSVYPNPTTGKFQVSGTQAKDTKVEVFDMLGSAVSFYRNKNEVDISHLQAGTYLVQLSVEGITQTRLLVKQ